MDREWRGLPPPMGHRALKRRRPHGEVTTGRVPHAWPTLHRERRESSQFVESKELKVPKTLASFNSFLSKPFCPN